MVCKYCYSDCSPWLIASSVVLKKRRTTTSGNQRSYVKLQPGAACPQYPIWSSDGPGSGWHRGVTAFCPLGTDLCAHNRDCNSIEWLAYSFEHFTLLIMTVLRQYYIRYKESCTLGYCLFKSTEVICYVHTCNLKFKMNINQWWCKGENKSRKVGVKVEKML